MAHDEKYSFYVEEKGNRQAFYFDLDENGSPIKLGDGTYGVVYKIFNMSEDELAVKLFYDNKAPSKIRQPFLTKEIIENFCRSFKIPKDDSIAEKLQNIGDPLDKLGEFALKLQSLNLTNKQYSFLLNLIHKESESIAYQRYKHEMEAPREIRKELRDLGRGYRFTGVIDNYGGTEHFRSSNAYKTLQKKFKESQIEVSDYAIVMPLYEYTLKDLLEQGIKKYKLRLPTKNRLTRDDSAFYKLQDMISREFSEESELISELENIADLSPKNKEYVKKNIIELTGYNLLQSTTFEKRISTVLPFLLGIGQGLIAIHGAKKFHYDLKPSNIFVRRAGEDIESVIGDLGFMAIPHIIQTESPSVNETLPLGTRHYRSPEQKDYFDICDVEVSHEVYENTVTLIVSDPKFRDSIIEPGDFLIFSKDFKRTKYYIAGIEKERNFTLIKLDMKEASKELLKPDKRTQVVFYKEQAVRTDLFGFGAIVFDLLTGGKSPERFYDNIRSYDNEDEDVDKIMELYRMVSSYQAHEPGLVHVFAPFKNEHDLKYAPYEIVELILKCMLYKAKNTFYRAFIISPKGSVDNHRAMAAVFDKLKTLDKIYPGDRLDNDLMNRKSTPSKIETSTALDKKINELQTWSTPKLPFRIAQGIWYYKKLVERVRDTIELKGGNIFFSEMLPQNILVRPEGLEFAYITYQTEKDYKDDLLRDLVYAKINRDITDPYIPNYIAFMRRKIQLKPIPDEKNTFNYFFNTSAILGDQIEEGDFININNIQLLKILSVSNHKITLEADEKSHELKIESIFRDKSDQFLEFVYYKKLDPCLYYLQILGTYLYNIFFVGIGNNTKDKPLIITVAKASINMTDETEAIRIKTQKIYNHDIKSIYKLITQIYLKLTFPENKNSYYKIGNSNQDRILHVSKDIDKLQSLIEKFLDAIPSTLDRPIQRFDDIKHEQLAAKVEKYPMEIYEFDNLIRSYLKISLQNKKNYYQEWNEKLQNKLNTFFKNGQQSSKKWINKFSTWGINQLEKGRLKLAYVLSILFVILLFIVGTVMLVTKISGGVGETPESGTIEKVQTDTTATDQQKK